MQPNFTATGGGGVFSAYIGPPDYGFVSPGTTAIFDGREAGIIKAGLAVDPTSSDYEDEGLLAFQVPNVDISTFAGQVLTYDVQNETGPNPVWVRIRLVGGAQYQFVPTTNPTIWHTVDAAAGDWYLMASGNATGPVRTLAQVASDNPGASVDRVYLTLGMGNSYNVSPGVGTVGWVDKMTIGGVTYDFVVLAEPATTATINAQKIVCDQESDLPNWGDGNPAFDVTSNTASRWLAANPNNGCSLVSNWSFEWKTAGDQSNPGGDVYGPKGGDWQTFTADGTTATANVPIDDVSLIQMREVLPTGYIPFTDSSNADSFSNDVSAEFYCASDVGNYDNWEWIQNPEVGTTYNCVGFNVADRVPSTTATISASKVVCDSESDLPNWGDGDPAFDITSNTADRWVAQSEGKCRLADWTFEWAPNGTGNPGDSQEVGGSPWETFTSTATVPAGALVWVREQFNDDYIPFTGQNTTENVSAELYCSNDVLNYDNYDFINPVEAGQTYNCVGFNVLKEQPLVCEPGVNLLANGSFETPEVATGNYGIFPEATLGLEWLVDWVSAQTGAAGLEIQDNIAGAPDTGSDDQFAELDAIHPVKISQNIPTIPGKEYQLSFKYSPRPGTESGTNQMEAYADGSLLGAILSGIGGGTTNWTSETRTFIADANTKIEFIDTDTDNSYGGYLDDVSLTCLGDPKVPCEDQVSSQTYYSDTFTTEGGDAAVPVGGTLHTAWTASIPSATWIWGEHPVTNPVGETTEIFTKIFTVAGTPTGGTLDIAADNSYSVVLNSNPVCADTSEDNYSSAGQDTCAITAGMLNNGTNTIEFTVKNHALADGTQETNPAGLLYKLTINENACVPPPPTTGHIIVTKVTDPAADVTEFSLRAQTSDGIITGGGDRTISAAGGPVDYEVTAGTYRVGELAHEGWTQTSTTCQGLTVAAGQTVNCTITNTKDEGGGQTYSISGMKWNDLDADSEKDSGEPGLQGWEIHISSGDAFIETTTTDVNGNYSFSGLIPNTYIVCETGQVGWSKTHPTGNTICQSEGAGHTVILLGESLNNVDFGNHETLPLVEEESGGNTRSGSRRSGSVLGASTEGQVLGASTDVCSLSVDTYMRKGYQNNPNEVKILQNFLNGEMGSGLVVDGNFGPLTEAAVKAFQLKYKSEIMDPWGMTEPSGIVYKTTLRKIKNLMCTTTNLPIPTDLIPWSANPGEVPPKA